MAKHHTSSEATPILQLLSDYSFDVEASGAEAMVTDWLQRFEFVWVSQAITEALYQGRYKMVSVDHILQLWQRRGQPLRHFNREFESIILGQSLSQIPSPAKASPAPLNFSQGQSVAADPSPTDADPSRPGRPTTEDSAPDAPNMADASTDASSLERHPSPMPTFLAQSPAPSLAEAPAPSTTATPETPTPSWLSSRTIPPLTPDQLARLAQPLTPAAADFIPLAPVADAPSAAIPGASLLDTCDATPQGTSTWADPAPTRSDLEPVLEPKHHALDNFPADYPENSVPQADITAAFLAHEPIPNVQPVAASSGVPSEPADSIPPFVPAPGPSELHQRLKAVVEAGRQDN